MRWERTAGLPVRRVAGRSVFAYKADIDKWLAGHPAEAAEPPSEPPPQPVSKRSLLLIAGGVAVLAAVILAAVAIRDWGESRKVAKAQIAGQELVAFDDGGEEIWRHRLAAPDRPVNSTSIAVADLDDDGSPEIVAAIQLGVRDGNEGDGRVFVLDGRGRVRWERALDSRFRFGEVEYGPGWFPDDLLVYRSTGGARVAVAAHHHTWWPDVVTTYDRDGRLIGQFVNAGWITRLNVTPGGRYLLAAGVSNSFGGPALAVLDGATPAGSSPSGGGTLPGCTNCPQGSPVRYFVTPWSDLARPAEMPFVGVVQVTADGVIEWRASQQPPSQGRAPEVIINLSPTFEVVRRAVDDFFVEVHTALERTGKMPPAASNWRQPVVREWTREHGWREAR